MSNVDLYYDIESMYIDGIGAKRIAAILECSIEEVYAVLEDMGVAEGFGAKKVVIQGLGAWKEEAKKQGYSVEGPSDMGMYQAYSKSGGHKGTFTPDAIPGPGSLRGNSKPGLSANSGTLYVKQGVAAAPQEKNLPNFG